MAYYGAFPPYVSVAEQRARAEKAIASLRKKGRVVAPVTIDGKKITTTFWGSAWCENLESYSDYESRLPRGRAYVRNGLVVHLAIAKGKIDGLVSGSSVYAVEITVASLAKPRWKAVVSECSGHVTSLVELLKGKLSKAVMAVVTSKDRGLFPHPEEIELSCSCPDGALLCKHVAAVMYGVGARLDDEPHLLFELRGVDPAKLLSTAAIRPAKSRVAAKTLAESKLGDIFGIEIDESAAPSRRRR